MLEQYKADELRLAHEKGNSIVLTNALAHEVGDHAVEWGPLETETLFASGKCPKVLRSLGETSERSSMTILPSGAPSAVTSKKTRGSGIVWLSKKSSGVISQPIFSSWIIHRVWTRFRWRSVTRSLAAIGGERGFRKNSRSSRILCSTTLEMD